MVVRPEPDLEFDLREIPRAIRRAGFVPAQMQLRARGEHVTAADGEPAFRIRGWKSVLKVRSGRGSTAGEVTLRASVDYAGEEIVLAPLR